VTNREHELNWSGTMPQNIKDHVHNYAEVPATFSRDYRCSSEPFGLVGLDGSGGERHL
jgi:hypothetical protein